MEFDISHLPTVREMVAAFPMRVIQLYAPTEENIDEFVALTANLLSDEPLFFLLNSYTTGLSASTMKYITSVRLLSKRGGYSEADELGLPVGDSGLALPCGSSVRVTFKK